MAVEHGLRGPGRTVRSQTERPEVITAEGSTSVGARIAGFCALHGRHEAPGHLLGSNVKTSTVPSTNRTNARMQKNVFTAKRQAASLT